MIRFARKSFRHSSLRISSASSVSSVDGASSERLMNPFDCDYATPQCRRQSLAIFIKMHTKRFLFLHSSLSADFFMHCFSLRVATACHCLVDMVPLISVARKRSDHRCEQGSAFLPLLLCDIRFTLHLQRDRPLNTKQLYFDIITIK